MTLSATMRKYGPEQAVLTAGAILAYGWYAEKGDTWEDWNWGEVITLSVMVFAFNFAIRGGKLLEMPSGSFAR